MSSHTAFFRFALATLAVLIPTVAWGHTGTGDGTSFMSGFKHPIGGLDHVLAMVAVGMFAANLGGRALWAVPLSFVLAMAGGFALGTAGVAIPYVETGIALSVVVIGLAVALRLSLPVFLAMLLVGVFAIFHGHAHGTELPADASGVSYAAGFMIATSLLHIAGILLGIGVNRIGAVYWARTAQVGGAAISLAGIAILTKIM